MVISGRAASLAKTRTGRGRTRPGNRTHRLPEPRQIGEARPLGTTLCSASSSPAVTAEARPRARPCVGRAPRRRHSIRGVDAGSTGVGWSASDPAEARRSLTCTRTSKSSRAEHRRHRRPDKRPARGRRFALEQQFERFEGRVRRSERVIRWVATSPGFGNRERALAASAGQSGRALDSDGSYPRRSERRIVGARTRSSTADAFSLELATCLCGGRLLSAMGN